MPYLTVPRKREIDNNRILPSMGGDLNYLITKLCLTFVDNKGACYATYNEVIGALECAKLEMYRRAIAPYEDKKIKENGDVYE